MFHLLCGSERLKSANNVPAARFFFRASGTQPGREYLAASAQPTGSTAVDVCERAADVPGRERLRPAPRK